ncbi:hypothetical protein BD410DRAFT_788752 [Rickenella mellea]|uniref:F-box domain-containing protein n=1 Tax=Rickenella mellea TaxID=50990 RepID=A0A4Y7Q572_9AGAM|nr:hypothetical protein BD410DRAFT_788752 [Rickenella mellea]
MVVSLPIPRIGGTNDAADGFNQSSPSAGSLSPLRHQLVLMEPSVVIPCMHQKNQFHFQILDIASLAPTFHAMKNLKALSVTVKEFRGSFTPPDGRVGGTPDRHSVPIDTLDLALQDRSKSIVIEPFYDYLSFLKPSTVNLSLEGLLDTDISLPRKSCLAGTVGIFPYGSTINTRLLPIDIPQPNTIHIEARTASFLTPWPTPWMIPQDDWKFFIPLRYIRLTRCDYLTEWEVHALATKLIGHARPKTGLQRLEVISCRGISVEFLLDLSEKVGSKLIWER